MFWRDRTIRVLGLLTLCVLLVTWGASSHGFGLRPLDYICSTLYAPLDWVFRTSYDTAHTGKEIFSSKVKLLRQMAQLEHQLEGQQLLLSRLQEVERENQRLKRLLNLPGATGYTRRAARVTGRSVTNLYHTLRIDAGAEAGLKPELAVVAGDGLVGQVLDTSLFSSTVLLLTDANSGVSAISADNRANGVIKGTGGTTLLLDYVAGSDLLSVGEEVLTSGLGGVYPKGLPVGVIASITHNPVTHVKTAIVVPYVDFSRLEEVSVLVPKRAGEAK